MLNLFMQVPGLVRKRLAKRCKEVYEQTVMLQALAEEGEDDELPQVRLARPPTLHPLQHTQAYTPCNRLHMPSTVLAPSCWTCLYSNFDAHGAWLP